MKRRCVLLAAALALLLAGCQAVEPEGSASLEPGPSQAVTVPSPLPETPAPTSEEPEPSPTLSPLEQLLGSQPMDDNHDAFLVDTKGRLGTLLVTVERGEQNDRTDGAYNTTLSVWDPQDMDKPMQEMEKTTYNVFHWHEELDANFDGYMDFSYMYAMGNQPSYGYLWIWDEGAGQFVEEPEYSTISCPRIDLETQVIDGWARNSSAGDGVTTFHRWEDGRLVCVRRIEVFMKDYHDDDSPWLLTVQDRINGELTEVFRMECPQDSDDYFSTRTEWENLDYHGEEAAKLEELLARQPRDEDHGAFLVDTRGKLGTLLVTVERGEQDTETEFGEYHYTLSVWNPADMDRPIQTFEEEAFEYNGTELIDADFDGYIDYGCVWNRIASNANFSLYLWDETRGKFALGATFFGRGGPHTDHASQTIYNYVHESAASGVTELYRWKNGELVCVREVERCYPDWEGNIQNLAVRDLTGGEMKEIYCGTFDLTSIFDEEEKWFDLDYHGE